MVRNHSGAQGAVSLTFEMAGHSGLSIVQAQS